MCSLPNVLTCYSHWIAFPSDLGVNGRQYNELLNGHALVIPHFKNPILANPYSRAGAVLRFKIFNKPCQHVVLSNEGLYIVNYNV